MGGHLRLNAPRKDWTTLEVVGALPGDGRVRIEPRCPGGCHSGDSADFDHYCDAAGVRPGEEGQAFAAWLNAVSGWDGEVRRVE